MRQLKITKSITNRESQSLDKYLQEIGKEGLINAEMEVELARKIKKGDGTALYVANVAESIPRGIELAREALSSGAARAKLDEFVSYTRRFSA